MQPEKIILIPATHEISTPSFHVRTELCGDFLEFLKQAGVKVAQPPEPLTEDDSLHEIRVPADTSQKMLERLMHQFLAENGMRSSDSA